MPLAFTGSYRFEDFELDPARRTLLRNGARVAVSPKAFEVLSYLVANPGRVITKEELLKAVWPDSFVEEGNLAQFISSLRKALTDRSSCIATIPGRGYQFTAKVEPRAELGQVAETAPAAAASFPAGQMQIGSIRERTSVIVDEVRVASVPVRKPARRVGFWMGVGATAVLAAWAIVVLVRSRVPVSPAPYRKIVLADFVNSTGNAAFDGTLRKALEIDLAQSPYMDVLGERAAGEALQLMGLPKNAVVTSAIAREICQRTNHGAMVSGTLTELGRRYLLTLEASECTSGEHLAGAKADAGTAEGVLEALDKAARQIRQELNESSQSVASYEVPLRVATTSSLEALKAYSVGMEMANQGRSRTECLAAFERAVELDPKFAMAYRMIGVENTYLGQTAVAARNYRKAYELSGSVSAREQLTIRAAYYAQGERNLIEAIKANRLFAATYPESATPAVDEMDAYMTLGRWDLAVAQGERAAKLFPQLAVIFENLSTSYRSLNRFADSERAAAEAARVGKGDTGLDIQRFLNALAQRDAIGLARGEQWFETHDDGATVLYYPALRGDALAARGALHGAEELYRKEYEAARRANLPEAADNVLIHQALAQAKLGMTAAAGATLGKLREFGTASPETAAVHAEIGDTVYVERYLAAHAAPTPDTLMTYVYVPRLRAALSLRRNKPLDALAALEPARPYELRDYTVPTLAAEAYVLTTQWDKAEGELRKIVDHPGIDSSSVLYLVAQLSLARVSARRGDFAASQKAYERFFLPVR